MINCEGCNYDFDNSQEAKGQDHDGAWYCRTCLVGMLTILQDMAPDTWHTYDLARTVLCASCGIGDGALICPDCHQARIEVAAELAML